MNAIEQLVETGVYADNLEAAERFYADVLGLPVPALLLYGENTFPFHAAIAARFRELRPDLRVLTLASAGHNVHRDRAEVVNAEIVAFLAGGSARGA